MKIADMTARLEEIRSEIDELEATEETEARFDELVAEFDELKEARDQAIAREEKREEIRNLAMEPANVVRGVSPKLIGTATDAPYSMDSVRTMSGMPATEARKSALESVKRDDSIGDVDKNQVRSLIERDTDGSFSRHFVAAASDEYRAGWAKVITGNEHALTSDEREAVAAVRAASSTGSAGGYAVPSILDPTIISTKAMDLSPLRQLATVKTITNDQWKGISSAGITATYAAEAAEVGDNAPTLAQPTITAEKAHAFVPASIEITGDWASIATDLAEMFAEAKADLEAVEFVTGSGSDAPTGLITALLANSTTTVVDTTTASAFGVVDVYALQEALPVRHRARASWGANNAIINDIRQFGSSLSHAFTAYLPDGLETLLNRPLYEFSAMDSVVTTNAEPLVFGDFAKFGIVDRVGLTVEYIPHLFATGNNRPSGQRGWYSWWRSGSNVLDANAFRVLQA